MLLLLPQNVIWAHAQPNFKFKLEEACKVWQYTYERKAFHFILAAMIKCKGLNAITNKRKKEPYAKEDSFVYIHVGRFKRPISIRKHLFFLKHNWYGRRGFIRLQSVALVPDIASSCVLILKEKISWLTTYASVFTAVFLGLFFM